MGFSFRCFDKSSEPLAPSQACHRFKYCEIQKATNNFDESLMIGEGCFGQVYQGKISYGAGVDDIPVAIKRLSPKSKVGEPQDWLEVENQGLFTLRHTNIVSLIGFCCRVTRNRESINKKETTLVYDYISNGTLKYHLHHLRTPLSWHQRLKICIDAARGLRFLHRASPPVVHRDVKSSNILLTKYWEAKISDFGLSKIGPTDDNDDPSVRLLTFSTGSFGYIDPSTQWSRKQTTMSDVYSFGVVLLEVLCRKPAVFANLSLVSWVQDSVKYKRMEKSLEFSNRNSDDVSDSDFRHLLDIIDADLSYEISPRSFKDHFGIAERCQISPKYLKDYFGIAERCLHKIPEQRPNMSEVVRCLESILAASQDALQSTGSVKEVSFWDLERATGMFSPDLLISEGGCGKVFQGWVEKKTLAPLGGEGVGTAVAVQWITSEFPQTHKEWLEEVNFFGQLAHPNIISLLGFCNNNHHERLLVYEHMNTSLSQFIHGDDHLEPLSWDTRLKVMIGVARGLTHLYTAKGVLCHFLCSDILLDEDFNAKIGGFGWLKIWERRDKMRKKGAFGYLQADYDISTGHLRQNNDICSFGFVMLETLTGRHLSNLDDVLEGLESLELRAPKNKSNRRKLKKMMDPRLKGSYSIDGAFKCMALALRCTTIQPEYSPSREEIVWSLEQIDALNK